MDVVSLRNRIIRLIHMHSSVLEKDIQDSGFECRRCGWCCRENFHIRITKDIFRPSNAISIFPGDIARIMKLTGMAQKEIAAPDIYSCIKDKNELWIIGWILRRKDNGECIFLTNGECSIYSHRPMICRCYPFFLEEYSVDIMQCSGLKSHMNEIDAKRIGLLLKRYEIKKLQNYTGIIEKLGDILDISNLCSLPSDFSGTVIVCDGEKNTRCNLTQWKKKKE